MTPRGRLVAPLLFAALVVATLAVLLVAQSTRTRLVVDEIELTNDFDPTHKRAAIRFRLTEDEESATLEVIDSAGRTVEILLRDEPLGDFEIHRFRWAGETAEPGLYRARLTLESLDREVVLPEAIELKRGSDG